MRLPETMPSQGNRFEAHKLDLPECCPVSRNPRAGSFILIGYRPRDLILEVGSLFAYVHQFRGGLKNSDGVIVARDMEEMIQRVASDCATVINVPVSVNAYLVLAPRQHMILFVRGHVESEVLR